MYALLIIALLLGFLGIIGALASFALPPRSVRTGLAVAASLIFACVVIVASLAFAQQPICEALGGGWHGPEASCRNEWGGNGDNDPS